MAALRMGRYIFKGLETRLLCPNVTVLASKPHSGRFIHCGRPLYADRKYTKEHEWVSVSDQVGTVGISDYAQSLLGDLVYVDLPEVGRAVEQSDVFGTVESVKAASDLYSPVTGEVIQVNTDLSESPELINKEPYGLGWIVKIKLSNLTELDKLMNEKAYAKYLAEIEE